MMMVLYRLLMMIMITESKHIKSNGIFPVNVTDVLYSLATPDYDEQPRSVRNL